MDNKQNKSFSMIADIEGDYSELSKSSEMPTSLPILAVRNLVLFPGVVSPILIGRESSMSLVKRAEKNSITIGIVCQRDPEIDEPGRNDLYEYGVYARVVKILTLPNGNPLAPYAGVQGVGVLKTGAEAHPEAIGKVLAALASPEVGVALAKSSGCAPANSKAYEDPEVAADELIVAIQKTAETAQPMPNIPEMGVLWGPAESFLVAVNKSGEDVATAAETAQQAALQAIADMQ